MSTALTTGRPWRVILLFSIPLLIGNVVQQLYQVIDAIVVGRHLGVTSLAAVGATGSLIFLLIGFAWGMTSGFAIPTAQAFGARDEEGVRRSVATGTILAAVVSILLTIAGPLLAEPFLVLLQTPASLLPEAVTFTRVTFFGIAAMMFFNYLAAIIRAIGDSRTPLVFLTISCLLNVGLVLLFVGTFEWGVGGAALATVIAQSVSVLLCLVYILRRIPVLRVGRDDWHVGGQDIADHLRLGLPMGFQASIISIGTLVVQVALNTLGADAVAAYTTATRVDTLATALLASLGLAASMYTAQNLGGRRPDRIRKGARQAVVMAIVVALLLGMLLISFGAQMVRLFIGEGSDEVVGMAHLMLVINGATYSLLGVLFVLRGVLQGLGNALIPTVTGTVELVMRVAAALLFGAFFGYVGVVMSNPLAWLGAIVILIPAFLRADRRLAAMPVDPDEFTLTTPVPIVGPVDGSRVVDMVVTQTIPLVVPGPARRGRGIRGRFVSRR